jgi:hypothetical protein
MATGFHGFHVIVGTIFLSVALWRQIHYHFTRQHHDTDISLMSYEFSYLLHFIDEVHKIFLRCHNIIGKVFRSKKRSTLTPKGGYLLWHYGGV